MILLNNFELTIVRARDNGPFPIKKKDGNVYVEVPDQTQYKIRVKCHRGQKGDATVKVDGESIGTFRLLPYQTVTLERPAGVNKCFMFCHEDNLTSDTDLVGKQQNGLISVDFVAELPMKPDFPYMGSNTFSGTRGYQLMSSTDVSAPCSSTMSHASGLTMLGDSTSQSFQTVPELSNVDEKSRTRIAIRLIGPAKKEPLTPLQKEKGLSENEDSHKMADPPRMN